MKRASREKNMTTRSKEGGLGGLVYADSQQEIAGEGLVLPILKWLDPSRRVVQGSVQGPIVTSVS